MKKFSNDFVFANTILLGYACFLLGFSVERPPEYLPPTPAQIVSAATIVGQRVVEVPVYHVEACPVCDCSVDFDAGFSAGEQAGVKKAEELMQMYPIIEPECTGMCKRAYRVPRK